MINEFLPKGNSSLGFGRILALMCRNTSDTSPAMSPTPPPMPPAPKPGWWARNWKWSVPVLAVSLVTAFIGFLFLVITVVFGAMKSSPPYKESVAKAMADPKVQEALGTPVNDGWFFTGNINISNQSGSAILDVPLHGSKGKGSLHVEGSRSGGVWSYPRREVTVSGTGEKIVLPP